MSIRVGHIMTSVAMALCLGTAALSQQPPRIPPPPPDESPAGREVGSPPLRDPTRPSDKMRDVLNTKAGNTKISPLALRGRVLSRNKPPAAILEVDGKLYTVSEGSSVTGAGNTILRVLKISNAEVQVESSPSKQVFILR